MATSIKLLAKEVTGYSNYFCFSKENITLNYNRRKQKQKYLAEKHISVFPEKFQNLYDHAKGSLSEQFKRIKETKR